MPIDQKALELARECTRVKGVSFRSFERERVRRIARALIAADEENTGLREAIENAPHPDYCAGWWTSSRYDKPSWVGVRRDKCNCWKSRALAAIDGEPEVCARCKGKRKIVLCCTCGELEGEQHKPSCQRQGIVTNESAWDNLRSEVRCPVCCAEPEAPKEWGVRWPGWMTTVICISEQDADERIRHSVTGGTKQFRTPAGPWQDVKEPGK